MMNCECINLQRQIQTKHDDALTKFIYSNIIASLKMYLSFIIRLNTCMNNPVNTMAL